MYDFTGKVAIVTGASRYAGIGRATALRLARGGAKVAVCSRHRAPGAVTSDEEAMGWTGLPSLEAELRARGGDAIALDCDVTVADQVEALCEAVMERWGRVDILINNAGASAAAADTPILSLGEAELELTLRSNLCSVFLVSQAAGVRMSAGGGRGAIVNVASVAGRQGYRNFGAYCAAKFGVIGLTQQLALELAGTGTRVNCVCPGSIDTEMLRDMAQSLANRRGLHSGKAMAKLAAPVPLGRLGAADEVASAISFLASDEASFITGQTLNVDGGSRMD